MGMNSICMYAGSEIFEKYFPFYWYTSQQSHWGPLFVNAFGTCMWVLISTYMFRKKIFIKI